MCLVNQINVVIITGKDTIIKVRSRFRHFKEAIPTRTFRPITISVSNIFDFLGNNVISVQWDNRPINRNGEEFYIRGATISRARWGKITDSITYVFDYQQLPRLWGEEALDDVSKK